MATADEARRERSIAALEAATRIYQGKGRDVSSSTITSMASAFLSWLEEKA